MYPDWNSKTTSCMSQQFLHFLYKIVKNTKISEPKQGARERAHEAGVCNAVAKDEFGCQLEEVFNITRGMLLLTLGPSPVFFSVTPGNMNSLISKTCEVCVSLFYNSILLNNFHKLPKLVRKKDMWACDTLKRTS